MKGGTVFGPSLKITYSKLKINVVCNKKFCLDRNLLEYSLILSPAKFINKTMKKTTYSCQTLNWATEIPELKLNIPCKNLIAFLQTLQ